MVFIYSINHNLELSGVNRNFEIYLIFNYHQ